jgi:hypothetical protein
MIDFLRLVDEAVAPRSMRPHEGQAYQKPRLDVIRHYSLRVRTGGLPILGRALSLVVIVEQPNDLILDVKGCTSLLERVGIVMSARHSPIEGLSLAVTTIVVTDSPVEPDDDPILARGLVDQPRLRMIPMAIFKVNLAARTMAQAVRTGPAGLFPEPEMVSEALTRSLRRFVPFLEI